MPKKTTAPTDNVPAFEKVDVASLTPYANNARTHSAEQVKQIAKSIQEFGFMAPIIIDAEGVIIAGHGRLLAAQQLGMKEVPALRASHLTPEQQRAYMLADNKIALNAGWDIDLLRVEIKDLQDAGFNIELTGFSDIEINGLFKDPAGGLTDPDEVQEVQLVPVTVEGDVWLLGKHRLICGDSTRADVVDRLLAGVVPGLMVTDPPYGVNYDSEWRLEVGLNKPHQKRATGKVKNDDMIDWREAWMLFRGDVAYVWHAGKYAGGVQASLEAAEFETRSQIVWAKNSLVIGRGNYHWQHEPCWYCVRKGKTANWVGDRKQSTLWQIAGMHANSGDTDDGKTIHSTQKPVECMRRPMENNSSIGQAVYDPFVGCGTSIIAAEQIGRHCYAVELEPVYVDVCVRRWQKFTGEAARLDGDGRTFDEVAAERGA